MLDLNATAILTNIRCPDIIPIHPCRIEHHKNSGSAFFNTDYPMIYARATQCDKNIEIVISLWDAPLSRYVNGTCIIKNGHVDGYDLDVAYIINNITILEYRGAWIDINDDIGVYIYFPYITTIE